MNVTEFHNKAMWLRHKFLDSRGADGATRTDWRHFLRENVATLREVAGGRDELIEELAFGNWQKKVRRRDEQQTEMEFAGHALPYILRFKQDGEWVSVLAEHATLAQAWLSHQVKADNHERTGSRLMNERVALDIATARAGGVQSMLLRDLQDSMAA